MPAAAAVREGTAGKGNSDGMEYGKLEAAEHESTRGLWERVFDEDTERFADYYYGIKAAENEIFAAKEAGIPRAMLHLNPYDVYLGKRAFSVHYIVGVATASEYRHRGLMRRLLHCAVEEMYGRREPFTFLMPAAEAIYRPFGFRFIYEQRQGTLSFSPAPETNVSSAHPSGRTGRGSAGAGSYRFMRAEDIPLLSEFSGKILRERFCVYAKRDPHYYEVLMAEQASENGGVILLFREGDICGWFYYGIEGGAELREIVLSEGAESVFARAVSELFGKKYRAGKALGISAPAAGHLVSARKNAGGILSLNGEKKIPVIMARIIHLEEFLSSFTADEPVSLSLEVSDDILPGNNGTFLWQLDSGHADVSRVSRAALSGDPDLRIGIADLTELLFGRGNLPLPENILKKLKSVRFYDKVFLNEIV